MVVSKTLESVMTQWFDVDKDGLAKLIENRGRAFVVHELVQNAWDTDAKLVNIWLEKSNGRPFAELTITDDDPNGFVHIEHAYTLFAESVKKDDPTKRGRFNLGEKLVLALCRDAEIRTTTGTVRFKDDGTRTSTARGRTTAGSEFKATIRMNEQEYQEACDSVMRLIPPAGVKTTFNGKVLAGRKPLARFEAQLPTEKADEQGRLTRTVRKCWVEVHEPRDNEEPMLYEMGIPVVSADKYHVNITQKIPLNMQRDNVTPAYLRALRALVLNHTADLLSKTDAEETWVTEALHHKDVAGDAVTSVMDKRFGKKRASYDPNDKEANNRLVASGYKIVHGGTFGKAAWENIRSSGAIKSSGEIKPTPKPWSDDPNAKPADLVPEDKWTVGMREVVKMAKRLAKELLGLDIAVEIVNTNNNFAACYGHGDLTFNLRKLGHKFFNVKSYAGLSAILDLLVHEFAHEYASNHLSEQYYDSISMLAGKLAVVALRKPEIFSELRDRAI